MGKYDFTTIRAYITRGYSNLAYFDSKTGGMMTHLSYSVCRVLHAHHRLDKVPSSRNLHVQIHVLSRVVHTKATRHEHTPKCICLWACELSNWEHDKPLETTKCHGDNLGD